MRVNVKWGKDCFKNVEVDLEETPLLFKSQLFTLSGVPPDRQKLIVKAKVVDDESWEKVGLKEGQTILLMGSVPETATIATPSQPTVFLEDLPVEQQDLYDMKKYGAGLKNLGNTCYMNSTMQLLYAVPELRNSVGNYVTAEGAVDVSDQLTKATGGLFSEMEKSAAPVMPVRFLLTLRNKYPQFAEMERPGHYKQQDAEECFSQVMHTLSEKVKTEASNEASLSQIHHLFGVDLKTTLVCKETEEVIHLTGTETKLKCNIPLNPPVHHIHEGIREGLKADREQNSEKTNANVLFEGKSEITRLPSYVLVHLVRFTYKLDTMKRAKILKRVTFPPMMDLYEFCSEDYKKVLDVPRKRLEELKDQEVIRQKEGGKDTAGVASVDEGSSSQVKALTGGYELTGLLTHKGRNANSGHYVSWIKQADEQWVQFDDEELILRKPEDILELSGGGDWHMAYLLLYKAQTVELPHEGSSTDVEMKE